MRTNLAKAVLFAFVCAAIVLIPSGLMAQVTTATISGAITDSTGAVMQGIQVVATEINTGEQTTCRSNDKGQYTLPFLKAGTYKIVAEAQGFKRFEQQGLALMVGDHPTDDILLQVGNEQQTVEVTAVSPQLQTEDDSLGQVVTTTMVEDLPLFGRTPMVLTQYTAGVVYTANPGQIRAFDNSGISNFSVGGLPNKNSEILMDGSPDNASDNSISYSPPMDAVSEVRMHVFASDAQYGHSAGGIANQITKGGTNHLHGTLSEFNQNSYLNANSYFNDRYHWAKTNSRYNQYGGSVGGPVFLPKLFNGRNKLFFFYAYEGLKDSYPLNNTTTVPTEAERTGDFSANLAEGSAYQLYDPYTGVQVGNVTTRQPYANNIIPASEISKIGQAILAYYPKPNITPLYADGTQNYLSKAKTGDNYYNDLARVDYNISARNKLFVTFRRNNRLQYENQVLGNSNPALGDFLSRINTGGTIADTYTLGKSLVGETRVNFERYVQDQTSTGGGFDTTTMGFPSYLHADSEAPLFPRINMSTSVISMGVPTTSYSLAPYNSYSILSDLQRQFGRHTTKIGVDTRRFQKGQLTFGNSNGAFSFDNSWVRPTVGNNNFIGTVMGDDVAALLLGLPSGGQFDQNASSVSTASYLSMFIQDDWRVRHDLTINLGLRYDKDFPAWERHGRVVNGFDYTSPSPIASSAIAAYNGNPQTIIPLTSPLAVNGGLTFASPTSRNIFDDRSNDFSPRIGFSYTPRKLGGNTSIRGGFGIFVQPTVPFNNQVNQQGFSTTTTLIASNDTFHTPYGTLANPFPAGMTPPSGSSKGLSTFLGQSITVFSPSVKNGYSQRWNLGFQRQLPAQTLVEAVYIGNHAVKLPINYYPNYINPSYLTTATNFNMNDAVANPFQGLLPNSTLNSPTISLSQLLSKYPEWGTITVQDAPFGSSYYNALDVRVEKRAGNGITLIANYQWSKLLERLTYLNNFDPRPEKRISTYDRPTHVQATLSYRVPYGKGRQFGGNLRRILDIPFGGWNVDGSYVYQTCNPLTWGDMVLTGQPMHYNKREAAPGVPAFNVNAFDRNYWDQPQNHIRTFKSAYGNLRWDGPNNFDASALKNFNFTEHTYFQLRVESFNAINRPQFGGPDQGIYDTNFGQITSTANTPRTMQIGGKIVF
jgi:hypothetical protein